MVGTCFLHLYRAWYHSVWESQTQPCLESLDQWKCSSDQCDCMNSVQGTLRFKLGNLRLLVTDRAQCTCTNHMLQLYYWLTPHTQGYCHHLCTSANHMEGLKQNVSNIKTYWLVVNQLALTWRYLISQSIYRIFPLSRLSIVATATGVMWGVKQ